ncbi:neprilysin-11-like [Drosophila takahashii]|uniref:neprilysin-11-like n=1 Tax=Drosophila takahashii TaxID=29030 RepID=UPI001CF8C7C2|nr:neprilysin-11-like [Drosophila takahashii]
MLMQRFYKDLGQIMEELQLRSKNAVFNESSVDAKALRYYNSCLKAPSQTWKMEHLLKLAPPGEGLSWPSFTIPGTEWPKDRFNWMDTLAILHRYGVTDFLIKLEVSTNTIFGREPQLKLSIPSLEEDLDSKFYKSIPYTKLQLLESQVRNLIKWKADPMEPYRYKSALSIEYITDLDWQKFIESIVGHRISPEFPLLVNNFIYFAALKRLMDSTDPELLANYFMFRFVNHLKKNTISGGTPGDCLWKLNHQMEMATNLLYKEHFQDSATLQKNIQEVHRIFNTMRRQLILQINRNRMGLSSDQKAAVIEKVQGLVLNIGNIPRDLDHRSFVNGYYEDIEISSEDLDYGRVQLELLWFRNRKLFDEVLEPSNTNLKINRRFRGPTSAYYIHAKNFIVIPFALLQEPFFNAESYDVFKYSLMGYVLGHELMHSIGTHGIYRDIHGKYLKIGDDILSLPQFKEGLSCMNRDKTEYLEERLADIEGAKLAYATYSSRNTKNLDKLFFRNMAQFFCEGGHSKNPAISHDERPVRLRHILKNLDAFSKAFKCPSQHKKCNLW